MIGIACVSPKGVPAGVEKNADEIMRAIHLLNKAEIILFPRLALSTSSCGDLFLQEALRSACKKALKEIAQSVKDQLVILGTPVETDDGCMFDMAAVLYSGKVQRFVPLFNSNKPFSGRFPNSLFGVPVSREPFYYKDTRIFIGTLGDQNSISLIPSCEPYTAGDDVSVYDKLKNLSKNRIVALAQAGKAESSTDYCHGGICGIAQNGCVLAYRGAFSEKEYCFNKECIKTDITRSVPFNDPRTPYLQGDKNNVLRDFVRIPAYALSLRLKRISARNMVLGLSGGLDSAMALLIAEKTRRILKLNKSALNIYTLPAQGTGKSTFLNAQKLCEALDIPLNTIDISLAVKNHLKAIGHSGDEDTTFENAQARERTQVLMDKANMLHGVMIGTGDMSELALGFTTYGGDHMSMYGVNAGLLKTMIRFAVSYAADTQENLAEALNLILKTPISPELKSSSQHTEKILGPYILNDFFLYYTLMGRAPDAIIQNALAAFKDDYTKEFLSNQLKAFYKRFFVSQFKRSCLPDGPQVTDISLSPRTGFKMPSDASPDTFTGFL